MIEKGKISNRQAMMLLVTCVLGTGLLTFPAITTLEAKQDAWISIFIAAAVGLAVIFITIPLGWRFPGMTIVEYSDQIVGKPLGKVVGFIYAWFFIYLAALSVREFAEFIVAVFMEETPLIVFIVTILFTAALAIYGGLEVISRVNEMMLVLVILSFFFFIFLAVGEMDPARLRPILAEGMLPVLKGSIPAAGWLSEVVVIAFLLPYLNRPALAGRSGSMAVLILFILHLAAVTASIMVFGPAQTGRMQFPAFMIARNAGIAGIFERSEAVFMLIWVGGVFVKIALYYYITVLATSQWLRLSSYRPLILPLGILIGVLAYIDYRNNPELVGFLHKVWGPYSIPIELGIPAVLLAVAVIRRKGALSKG